MTASRADRRAVLSRRTFTAVTAGFFATHGFNARAATGPNEKLDLAVIGIGGQGGANLKAVSHENIVALCDVDERRGAKGFAAFPAARRFADFRRLFDAMEKEIDAVVVSTPDHTHFHPAWWAIDRGKHVYLEKPLAHEVAEVRRLCDAARAKKVATQLGCQRHALQGLRDGVEIVRSGMLGAIREVHSWVASDRGMPKLPPPVEAVPAGLDWDLWLGPAPLRPYTPGFAPYDWRFWWDYGTGETGNWGCHILDIPFWALELAHPTRVTASGPEPDPQRTPKSLVSRLDFPARTGAGGAHLPPVAVHWHQGKPPILNDLAGNEPGKDGKRPSDSMNNLFIGAEGSLLCGFGGHRLLPAARFADAKPPRTIPPSPGFHREWLAACRGGPAASCNFDYAGPLAESVLLANVAFRVQGAFDWDAAALKSSRDDVDALLRREYRQGWET